MMLGIDGWGDARCGDLESTVQLSDWKLIDDFKRAKDDREIRIEICKRLGGNEARAMREKLALTSEAKQLLVLTHVPPPAAQSTTLSSASSERGGISSTALQPNTANWCTFGTWASCTVGGNLRGRRAPKVRVELDEQRTGPQGRRSRARPVPAAARL